MTVLALILLIILILVLKSSSKTKKDLAKAQEDLTRVGDADTYYNKRKADADAELLAATKKADAINQETSRLQREKNDLE